MKKIYGLLTVLLLAGCAADKAPSDLPVENLYNNALMIYKKQNIKKPPKNLNRWK